MCSLKKNQLAVGLMALVLQPSSAAFSGASTSRAAVHGVPLTVAYRAPTMPSCSRRSTHAVMLAADDAERQSKRAAVDMRLFEESVECDAECVAEAMHVEDCLRKLVKLSKHDADSDVWEGDEWAESLQQLLDQDMLPTYPESWS